MVTSTARRNLGRLMIGGTSVACFGLKAQTFPSKPLKIIVAFTAGTGSDLLARNFVPELSRYLSQQVIVENRPGAGGMIGTDAGARATADGYTLTIASAGAMLITPAMNPSTTPYRFEKDFVAIGGLARSAFALVTANSGDAPKSLSELAVRAKSMPNPVPFASPGSGTNTHLAGELMLKTAGIRGQHISYRGSAQALSDVVSGQVLFGFDTVGATLPLVKAGKLRAIAISAGSRLATLPEVPTMAESGLKDFTLAAWWGLFAPKGTPVENLSKVADALAKTLDDREVKRRFALQEVEPYPISGVDLTSLVQREEVQWSRIVQDLNMVQKT